MTTIFKVSPDRTIHPNLLKKMKSIVETVIPNRKFQSDFEINDKTVMERSGPTLFAWYVYEFGTHLMPLNNMEEVRKFQKEWLDGYKEFAGKKKSENDRLYVFNIETSEIRQVYNFKEEPNLANHLLKSVV